MNDYSDERISDYTEISPNRFLSKNNLILWTILNGFKMFPVDNMIIITMSDFMLTDRMLIVAGFVYSGEKSTDIGILSIDGDKEYGNVLFAETDDISLRSFAITRSLANDLENALTDELIFGRDVSDDELAAMLKFTGRRMIKLTRI